MRSAQVKRETKETKIAAELSLDAGKIDIDTGVGFFDHMLTAMCVHGGLGLELSVQGDLEVDCHHTVEDTGIVLGKALEKALGGRAGLGEITRYGHSFIPMDEALCECALDISGRPFLVFNVLGAPGGNFPQQRCGDFDTCMTEEFFRALSVNGGLTLHIDCKYGKNAHHMIEAAFKAFGHALRSAAARRDGGALSTKGVL